MADTPEQGAAPEPTAAPAPLAPAPTMVSVAPPGQPAPATPGISETVEGGKYLVNGQWQDADGNPFKGKK